MTFRSLVSMGTYLSFGPFNGDTVILDKAVLLKNPVPPP